MAKAANAVVSGENTAQPVKVESNKAYIVARGVGKEKIWLTSEYVKSFRVAVVNDPGKKTGRLKHAVVGGLLLGPVGLAAAAWGSDAAVYTVVIDFLKGTQSTIEIDTKRYKAICQSCPDLEVTNEPAEKTVMLRYHKLIQQLSY